MHYSGHAGSFIASLRQWKFSPSNPAIENANQNTNGIPDFAVDPGNLDFSDRLFLLAISARTEKLVLQM
ncbi:MAG TPA: hypothetical protein P5114_03160 [Hyphomicrobiaceae bacterium]|nr:hypothetical protein [Hyphomicrobiaceae bacterium]